jgi:TonB family protein
MHAARLVLLVVALLLPGAEARAQESLDAARELYAAAQYDDALTLLDRLAERSAPPAEQQAIDLYRTLCLLATGRRDEAERAIEQMIARDPMFRPADDLSPKMRLAFHDAKKRVLPTIVQQRYQEARRAFDGRAFDTAADAFRRVIETLDDPDLHLAAQPAFADLRTLAAGFHDLSVKAMPPPLPPAPAPAPAPEPPPAPRIYASEEAGLRIPSTIAQELPRYPGIVPLNGIKGIVEVIIDEKGSVESAAMIASVGSAYDKAVLSATGRWQFAPATLHGTPVKFRKRIQINIAPAAR